MAEKNKSKKTKVAIIIFIVTALLATVFTTVLALGETKEGYRTITVIEISGTVGVVRDNMEYAAYTGMHLEEGYSVVTSGNSYIRMLLDDDKYVKLEAGSKAVFEELSGGKTAIRIERGSLVSEITKPLAVDEDFIVNTPNAVLAVRGTLFRVDLSRTEKGELNTDVMTYGGAVSSKRVQPDGKIDEVEVTITEGFKATVNMDDKETVYMVDEVKIDIEHLVGNTNTNADGNSTTIETNVNGEVVTTPPLTLESVLKPITVEDIPDDDLVDIYFAAENGHSMFVETEQLATQIEKRDIDITSKTSVYEVAEKVENPVEIVIPDDNVPLTTTTEPVTEAVAVVQGPPTDGVGTTNTHKHQEVTETVVATCTTDGKTIVKCSDCNLVISETPILATGHTIVSSTTIKPTCKSKGSRTDGCSVCGEVIAVVELAQSGHTTKITTANPTCTTAGKSVVSCTVCGEKISETIKNATGHNTEKIVVEATCTNSGSEITKCTVCDEVISETIIPVTSHKEIYSGTKDSHTECENCGEILSASHKFKEVVVEPTCTTSGGKTYSCDCGYIYEEKTSAIGHTTETTVVDATCTTDGSKITVCTVCNETLETLVLNGTGHTEKTTTVDATCTLDGKTTVTCTVCNKTISETVLTATGHTETNGGTDAVHTKCSVCDLPLVTEHELSSAVTKVVTCLVDGETTYSCGCGYSYTEPITAPGHTEIDGGTADAHTKCNECGIALSTEHDLQETVNVKEDCVTDGSYTYTCECGYEFSQTVTKLGHTEVDGGDADIHTKCDVCGETVADGTAHSYTSTVTTENSCTTEGELTYTCTCGWSYTEPVPASHTKSDESASVTTCSVCGSAWVDLTSENFPDNAFLSFVSSNYNTDSYATDEALVGAEITGVTSINVAGDSTTDGGYTDLTGIKHFTNLTNLYCGYNAGIETLDLSGLTMLTNLDISGLTGLKTLNISGCINLTEDRITGLDTCTELTILNVRGCTNIAELNLNGNAKLKTVDLSDCNALTSFIIDDNSTTYALQSIDLSGCTALETLTINNALSLTTIDFTDLAAIKTIDLGGCQGITGTLDVSNKSNLASLTMGALIRVTSLNVSGCTSLVSIDASACSQLSTIVGLSDCTSLATLTLNGTGLTSVDVTSNSALTTLNVANCSSLTNLNAMRSTESTTFNSLNTTNCTALKTLNLYNCKGITTLDTTTLTALEELDLTYSGVTTFNSTADTMSFSSNTNLKNVYLNGITSFTGFDISANTLLEEFSLADNTKVTSLDFTNNANLKKLALSDVTALTGLDVSACTALESFNVLNTGITSLSVTGSSALTQFWVYNNTSLASISLTGATSLTSVKLSAGTENTALTSLVLTDCGLTSLDVTYLTALTTLDVTNCTSLTSITGLNSCTALETLTTTGSGITSLDLSSNTALTSLNITGCTSLTSLDVSNTKISGLTIDDTYTSLDSVALNNVDSTSGLFSINNNNVKTVTAQNINVQSFGVTSTSVISIDLTGATIGDGGMMAFSISGCGSSLETLTVSDTNLTTLPTETMSALKTFSAENCTGLSYVTPETMPNIESLDISGCINITTIDVTSLTALTSLDISGCTGLGDFTIETCTNLVSLNVSGTAITMLDASYNQVLQSIDMSDCTELIVFAMASGEAYDQLSSVNASGCTAITDFQIESCSSLTTLDLSGLTSLRALYLNSCTGLTDLNVSNTAMTSLDVSTCAAIANIDITGTSMTSANITLPDGVTPTITGP